MILSWVLRQIYCSVYSTDEYLLLCVRNMQDKLVAAVIFLLNSRNSSLSEHRNDLRQQQLLCMLFTLCKQHKAPDDSHFLP
jgi:hypothetical protein